MKKYGMALILLTQACVSTSVNNELPKVYDPTAVIAAMVQLHDLANKNWPENIRKRDAVRSRGDFDVAKYFDVLTNISPPDGQTLDYAYKSGQGGGRPELYFRATNAPPFLTYAEYTEATGGRDKGLWDTGEPISDELRLNGSAQSFFEQLVFDWLAGQFYLSWHSKYNDTAIIVTREDVERIIAMLDGAESEGLPFTMEQKAAARKADVSPRVTWVNDQVAEVSVVIFTKWGGFLRDTKRVSRSYPHKRVMGGSEGEMLVEYDCRMMY